MLRRKWEQPSAVASGARHLYPDEGYEVEEEGLGGLEDAKAVSRNQRKGSQRQCQSSTYEHPPLLCAATNLNQFHPSRCSCQTSHASMNELTEGGSWRSPDLTARTVLSTP